MNGGLPKPAAEIAAMGIVQLSDRHWSVLFPYPGAAFFDDMGWGVSAVDTGANLEWAAYGLRKLPRPDGSSTLEIRFVDNGRVATPGTWTETEISAVLLPTMP